MITIPVNYENYNEEMVSAKPTFHLNKTEAAKIDMKYKGLKAHFDKLQSEDDREGLYDVLEYLVIRAYGERTSDGEGFAKNQKITERFKYSAMLPEVMIEVMKDEKSVTRFMMGCMSKESRQAIIDYSDKDPQLKEQLASYNVEG